MCNEKARSPANENIFPTSSLSLRYFIGALQLNVSVEAPADIQTGFFAVMMVNF